MSALGEGIITIAYGPPKYVRMAKALSLSYRRHKPKRPIAIITDEANAPGLKPYFDVIIPMKPEHGLGVVQKLHLDVYSPFEKTLFIDSDCLFYKHPDILWHLYAHNAFSMRGWRYLTGETEYEKADPYRWVHDMRHFLGMVGITRLAHFNSGVFFFDQSATAVRVFSTARSLYDRRAELGFASFKGAPIADEPAFAAAMEKCGINMDPWDSTRGMETAIGMRRAFNVNVLKGRAHIFKSGTKRSPTLIHFNVHAQHGFIYTRDLHRLLLEHERFRSVRVGLATAITCVPAFCERSLKLAASLPARVTNRVPHRLLKLRTNP